MNSFQIWVEQVRAFIGASPETILIYSIAAAGAASLAYLQSAALRKLRDEYSNLIGAVAVAGAFAFAGAVAFAFAVAVAFAG